MTWKELAGEALSFAIFLPIMALAALASVPSAIVVLVMWRWRGRR